MGDELETPCYGLDVSNDHDNSVISFKFLDTNKIVSFTQLELSIMANYILDQYSSIDEATETLKTIKAVENRIDSLESCLST